MDEIVREDDIPRAESEGGSAADEEIHNLVAIPIYVRDNFSGVIVCADRDGGFEELDDEVLLSLGDHAGAVLHNGRLRGELREAYIATIRVLTKAIEAKDPLLGTHSGEVSGYVSAVAKQLDLDLRRREELVFASLLHDVGKIGISERILLKPGRLTPEERTVIELHPRIGCRIVEQVPALRPTAAGILHHHERYDGAGYPSGLRGEDIPLEARVIAIADSFSAMTAMRPYSDKMSVEDACLELERCAGGQFDPNITRLFTREVRQSPPGEVPEELAVAMSDPEIEVRRSRDEPLLGYGSYSIVDNLTLLYSHRHLHEMASAEAVRAELQGVPFVLALVELVGLDRLNESEGYAAGDAALLRTARAVQSVAALHGGVACRYSGSRLALLVPNVTPEVASRLSSELSRELSGGPRVRFAVVVWEPQETESAVIARARRMLSRRRRSPPAREPTPASRSSGR